MNDQTKPDLLGTIRPLHLVIVLGLYLEGAGLALYLGARLDLAGLGLGSAWLLCLTAGIFLLGDIQQYAIVINDLPFLAENSPGIVSSPYGLSVFVTELEFFKKYPARFQFLEVIGTIAWPDIQVLDIDIFKTLVIFITQHVGQSLIRFDDLSIRRSPVYTDWKMLQQITVSFFALG